MAVIILGVAGYLEYNNYLQQTPLFYAVRNLDLSMIRVLLFFGAKTYDYEQNLLDRFLLSDTLDR